MKRIAIAFFCLLLMTAIQAQKKCEKQVATAVEQLRKAMVAGDSAALNAIVFDELSYGHSGGHIDDKKTFIRKLAGGGSDFVTMDLSEQTILVKGKTAIVRHKLDAKTNDNNKPGEVHLLVMLVWQKKAGKWKLLGRQAVKLTT
ncbi:MAG: nuclear transport factor 2 family protein [Chitinophagaceae bacterium]|nr:nuclear transport factor 2 family protein [Chitinophagaceae bacterium]